MQLSTNEMLALLKLKQCLEQAGTPVPQFLHWIADRLTLQKGDAEFVDFVQALRKRASQFHEISELLSINRGPERIA